MIAVLLARVIMIPSTKVYAVYLDARCTMYTCQPAGVDREEARLTARPEAAHPAAARPGATRREAARPAATRRERLNTERVLRAAVALADEAGIGAVSMRRLAQ